MVTSVKQFSRMKPGTRFFIFAAILFLLQVVPCHGNAILQIRFDTFFNSGNLKADGFCCDGERRGSNCTGTCDYSLQVCLGTSEETPCDITTYNAGAVDVSSNGDITFVSGLANPLSFDIETWKGNVAITFNIMDEDTSRREAVDTFTFTYKDQKPIKNRLLKYKDYSRMTLTGERQVSPTSIQVGVAVMCGRFYYSNNCSINCVPSDDCGGHYDCDVNSGERICLRGWGGDACNIQLSTDHGCAADQVCEHGSTCVPYGNQQYYCCCSRGYEGQNCEIDINECDAKPCQNGGTCSEGKPGTYQCDCTERFKGKNCEVSKTCAVDSPCQNGASCVPLPAGTMETFYCLCQPGHTGYLCDIQLTTTAPTTVTTTTEATTVTTTTEATTVTTTTEASTTPPKTPPDCPWNFYGEDCSVYCDPVDDCTGHYGCNITDGAKVCLLGWTGENCTSKTYPDTSCSCANGGTCFRDQCCCEPGFTGPQCETQVLYCDENTCLNQGSCSNDGSGVCLCPGGFTGDRCEKETILFCDENTCLNQGTCSNQTSEIRCLCPVGFTGSRCETEVLLCDENTCLNQGSCSNDGSGVRCLCPEGFTGTRCETEILVPICVEDFYGPQCGVYCKPQDSCDEGQYTCNPLTGEKQCRFGWMGPDCDIRDPGAKHDVACPDSKCRNGGQCFNNTCCCPRGFTGSLCHIEILECATAPCKNGGRCQDLIGDYVCECSPEFTGKDCETRQLLPGVITTPPTADPCTGINCANDGTCAIRNATDFICLCVDGFMGELCDQSVSQLTTPVDPIFQCSPNLYGPSCEVYCEENASCGRGHYYCDPRTGDRICRNGWGGPDCTVRLLPQDNDPECPRGVSCLNGGSCFNGTCCCSGRFSGKYCEMEELPCDSQPCLNGICRDLLTDYQCSCNPGFDGRNCQTFVGFPETTSTPFGFNSTPGGTDATTGYDSTLNTSDVTQGNSSTLTGPIITTPSVASSSTPEDSSSSTESSTRPTPAGLVCGSKMCYNGGLCFLYDTGVYNCSCPSDFTGEQCEIPVFTTPVPSLSNSSVETSSSTEPTTNFSSGILCGDKICYNDATCLNGNSCVCKREYRGMQCEIPDFTTTTPNLSNTSVETSSSQGLTANSSSGILCGDRMCYNGATCSNANSCVCTIEFIGEQCEIPVFTTTTPNLSNTSVETSSSQGLTTNSSSGISCGFKICYNGATCFLFNGGTCVCTLEFTGEQCEIPVLTTTVPNLSNTTSETTTNSSSGIPCGDRMCYNGATCSNANSCVCTIEFIGEQCEIPVFTTTTPNLSNTSVETSSSQGLTTNSSSGISCGFKICYNGATCFLFNGGTCVCTLEFRGEQCEIPVLTTTVPNLSNTTSETTTNSSPGIPCGDRMCYNGATCSVINSCVCTTEFTGEQCDIPVFTTTVPNLSNSTVETTSPTGLITNSSSGISCGFKMCYNGATCFPFNGGTCVCTLEFRGEQCQIPVLTTTVPNLSNTTSETTTNSSPGIPCGDRMCYNGATCFPFNGGTCVCTLEFTGEQCQIPVLTTTVPNLSNTTSETTSSTELATNSSFGIACGSKVCYNGATCLNGDSCVCTAEFTGEQCEIPVFTTIPSLSNTTAETSSSTEPTTGSSAGIICGFKICYNGATCLDDFSCVCTTEFRGEQCDIPVFTTTVPNLSNSSAETTTSQGPTSNSSSGIPCGDKICYNDATCLNGNTCVCRREYVGRQCETPVFTTTEPIPLNSSLETTSSTGLTANSSSGIPCGDRMCYNGATCSVINSCVCTIEFIGEQCEIPIFTTTVPNLSNSTVENTSSTGPTTNSSSGISCGFKICYNGATCFLFNGGTCVCTLEFTGEQCEIPIFTTTVPNLSNTTFETTTNSSPGIPCGDRMCYNGATCSVINSCVCTSEFTGEQCDISVFATTVPNLSNSTVETSSSTGPTTNSSSGIPCGDRMCYNGATCSVINSCVCTTEFTGEQCDISVFTTTVPNLSNSTVETTSSIGLTTNSSSGIPCGDRMCYNGATCSVINSCVCTTEFTGEQCETPIFTTTVPNLSNSTVETTSSTGPTTNSSSGISCGFKICYNGATCFLFNGGTCVCTLEFTGEQCEIPVLTTTVPNLSNTASETTTNSSPGIPCGDRMCYNGATCSVVNACVCTAEFTGEQCEIPVFTTVPSLSNTTAETSSSTGPTTNSSSGIPCGDKICYNGATCSNGNICVCGREFRGIQCEIPVFTTTEPNPLNSTAETTSSEGLTTNSSSGIPCGFKTCYNGASCLVFSGGSCVCTTGFTGAQCDIPVMMTTVSPNNASENSTYTPSSTFTTDSGNSSTDDGGIVIVGDTTSSGPIVQSSTSPTPSSEPTTVPMSSSAERNTTSSVTDVSAEVSTGHTTSTQRNPTPQETSTSPENNSSQSTSTVLVGSSTDSTTPASFDNSSFASPVTPQTVSSTSSTYVTSDNPASGSATNHVTSPPTTSSTARTTQATDTSSSPSSTPATIQTTDESASNRGEIYITGRIPRNQQSALVPILESSLTSALSERGCCSSTKMSRPTTFIDPDGNFVDKFEFFYVSTKGRIPPWTTENTDFIHQSVDSRLQTTEPFSTGGNRVYVGSLDGLRRLDDAYSLDVIGDVTDEYAEAVKMAVVNVWTDAHPNCQCSYHIPLMVRKPYVGEYGTRMTHVYYFVTKEQNGQEEDQAPALLPPPAHQTMTARFTANTTALPYALYDGANPVPFDLHRSLLLSDQVKMADSEGQEVLSDLHTAWEQYVNSKTSLCAFSPCSVNVTYVRPELYYKADGTIISKLDYFVTVNGNVLDAAEFSGPTEQELQAAQVPVCACAATPVYHVDISGSLTWSDAQALGDDLIATGTSSKSSLIVGRTSFLDASGSPVTRIYLMPSNSNTTFSPPDMETANRIAEDKGLDLLAEPIRQQYTVALDGIINKNDTEIFKQYIRNSWHLTNMAQIPESAISVEITDVDSSYFSDRSYDPVTVVTYTVTVGQADSSLTYADEPALTSLTSGFQSSSYKLCACNPLTSRQIDVVGPVDQDNITKVELAIAKAWKEENPNFQGILRVKVQDLINGTGRNGEKVTGLVFTVSPEPGSLPPGFTDRELQKPKNNTLNTAFKEADLEIGVYANEEKEEPFPWWIPVGIILGLLFLIVIIIILFFIIRDQRRRKSREVKQKLEQLNGYDKEHFSSEPEFRNPTFAVDDPDLADSRTGIYVVNMPGRGDGHDD